MRIMESIRDFFLYTVLRRKRPSIVEHMYGALEIVSRELCGFVPAIAPAGSYKAAPIEPDDYVDDDHLFYDDSAAELEAAYERIEELSNVLTLAHYRLLAEAKDGPADPSADLALLIEDVLDSNRVAA